MPRPVPRELGTPEHLSALYDRVARLERRKQGTGEVPLSWFVIDDSNGVTGVTNSLSPNYHVIIPAVGTANVNIGGSDDAPSVFFYHTGTGQIDFLIDGTYVLMAYANLSGLPVGTTVNVEWSIPSSGPSEFTNYPDDGAGAQVIQFTCHSSPIACVASSHVIGPRFIVDAPSYGGTFDIDHWGVKAVRLGGYGGDSTGLAIT